MDGVGDSSPHPICMHVIYFNGFTVAMSKANNPEMAYHLLMNR